mmetsp:Transcript_11019/g.26966  ORF Transcript_11019/g.26966 Transcript_11019/m.26966 type:complete len:121 (+) Transcript_11019:124-486(+)|eukprot:CAMPEP_0178995054 /NCGR_PEP_ID=MMETSP0795-20121207/7629_1 /TAXON_ID=88552 /ORGANISM="Amoebophrya sp., Strain Ameob2" /LENGTH=120 /DNA_ID=CAMNT_0020687349 /DNA_START=122 /DNA_END=484 /DNA_ORIENTATION=-
MQRMRRCLFPALLAVAGGAEGRGKMLRGAADRAAAQEAELLVGGEHQGKHEQKPFLEQPVDASKPAEKEQDAAAVASSLIQSVVSATPSASNKGSGVAGGDDQNSVAEDEEGGDAPPLSL